MANRLKANPLTASDFEALRRDSSWQVNQVYSDAFTAERRGEADSTADRRNYLVRSTGDTLYPYVLYGPLSGEPEIETWPSKRDARACVRRARLSLRAEYREDDDRDAGGAGMAGPSA